MSEQRFAARWNERRVRDRCGCFPGDARAPHADGLRLWLPDHATSLKS
jgi:hypothetical protein